MTTDANEQHQRGETPNADNSEPMEGTEGVLADVWRTVAEWSEVDKADWLRNSPPPRRYLLSTKFKDTHKGAEEPRGVLPLGRVGMLAAGGGVGKSWALVQLALSVATGREWLGTFQVDKPGAVLLALGEEEAEEIRRRLYQAVRLLGLTEDERTLAAKNIVALPLCGKQAALTFSPDELRRMDVEPSTAEAIETPFARELRDRLDNAAADWRLVVLDPLSRFAGPDVEIDNAAATRVVQCFERLTETRGRPTVLVSHHTTKTSRSGTTDATAARGSSALSDGVRWQANLDSLPHPNNPKVQHPDLAVLRVTKNNYGCFPPELYLHRDRDNGGALRAATQSERDEYKEALREAKVKANAEKRALDREAAARARENGGASEDYSSMDSLS